jgi:uncharacterized protein YaiE (UPF0345 family)
MNTEWDNSYFDGLILSKNTTIDGLKATEGVMHKGELPQEIEANAGREKITITAGILHYKPRGAADWSIIKTGESFVIPAATYFLWKVEDGEMRYECVYLDKPAA